MKRVMVTREKFYDIRRMYKCYFRWNKNIRKELCKNFEVSPTTLTRILQSRNFREYKASGQVYGKGVKVLRKRYMFILFIIAIMAMFINLLIK